MLSNLIRAHQANDANKISQLLLDLTPDWVENLGLVSASTHSIELLASIQGKTWLVTITSSFHGAHVRVHKNDCKRTQSRLSKDLALRANF
jgi:hypothetical protein